MDDFPLPDLCVPSSLQYKDISTVKAHLIEHTELSDREASIVAIRLRLRSGVTINLPEIQKRYRTGKNCLSGAQLRDMMIEWGVHVEDIPELKGCFPSFLKVHGEDIEQELEVLDYAGGGTETEDCKRGGGTKGLRNLSPSVGSDCRM